MVNYVEELRIKARYRSNAHKRESELVSKILSKEITPLEPEETLEWKVADYIEELEAKLGILQEIDASTITPSSSDSRHQDTIADGSACTLKVGDFVKTTLGDAIVEEGGVLTITIPDIDPVQDFFNKWHRSVSIYAKSPNPPVLNSAEDFLARMYNILLSQSGFVTRVREVIGFECPDERVDRIKIDVAKFLSDSGIYTDPSYAKITNH